MGSKLKISIISGSSFIFLIFGKTSIMTVHLIDIGNSKGVMLPKNLIEKYGLDNELEIKPMDNGIFISKKKNAREGWNEQIKKAIASGDKPEKDELENINSDWDNVEWTWPE